MTKGRLALPSPRLPADEETVKTKAQDLSVRLSQAFLSQRIMTNSGSQIVPWAGWGEFFNSGIGMLQLGLQENWFPTKADDDIPATPPMPGRG